MGTTTLEERDIGYGQIHLVDARDTTIGTVENPTIGITKIVHKCTVMVNGMISGVMQDFHTSVSLVHEPRKSATPVSIKASLRRVRLRSRKLFSSNLR